MGGRNYYRSEHRQTSDSELNPLQLELVMTNDTCCNDSCGQGLSLATSIPQTIDDRSWEDHIKSGQESIPEWDQDNVRLVQLQLRN